MLDLSKPLDSIEGLTLFGDHENPDLVYYLPDEIELRQSAGGAPDISLQIYYPEEAIAGGVEALEDSVGAILSLGVQCGLSADREREVRNQLATQLGNENIRLVAPPWEGGTVDLLLLDVVSGESLDAAFLQDRLVKGVVGTRKPSFDGQLSALFHARLDQRGTALAVAALEGEVGTLAGILYDLKFAAMRPTVDMRMRADLNRMADFIRAGVGVQAYYVSADVSAAFSDMQEEGIIDVNITSQVADPEAERMVNEAVKDFYDVLMRELFRPIVSPAEAIGVAGAAASSVKTSIVRLSFAYVRAEQDRIVEVDYSKRSATLRTHNPQSHLRDLADFANGGASLIQRVPLSEAWREFAVEIDAPAAFDDEFLQQIQVLLWRGQDGVLPPEEAREDGLLMPADATPLVDMAFTRNDSAVQSMSWVIQPDEAPFYRWQARLSYKPDEDIVSDSAIWSEAHISTSQDLDLFASALTPLRRITLRFGAGRDESLQSITADIAALTPDNREIATNQLLVDRDHKEDSWAVRHGEAETVLMERSLTYHFEQGRTLSLPPRALLDQNLVANDPFARRIILSPQVLNPPDDLLEVLFLVRYRDEETGYEHREQARIRPPDFGSVDLTMPVLHSDNVVTWEAIAVNSDGTTITIGTGEMSEGGPVVLQVSPDLIVQVKWLGAVPADLDLRWVKATFGTRREGGEMIDPKVLEWRGTDVLEEQTVVLSRDGVPGYIVKRMFIDGSRERDSFKPIQGNLVIVSG